MNLLKMSLSASIMVLVVLLARSLGRKYISKTTIIALWDLILVRALLPFRIPPREIPILKESYRGPVALPIDFSEYGLGQVSVTGLEKTKQVGRVWNLGDGLLLLWVVGTVCLFLYFVRVYINEYQLLKNCIPIQNETADRLIRNA